jgi:DNA-binding transcriptional ArsR family regulator
MVLRIKILSYHQTKTSDFILWDSLYYYIRAMGRSQSGIRQEQIDWRREKILDLTSKGHTIREIADIMKMSHSTVGRDIEQLRKQAKANISQYIDERLLFEYQKCLTGLDSILKHTWAISNSVNAMERDKLQAISVGMQAYSMKIDLLTNATVVQRAVDFVDRHKGLTSQKKEVTTIDNDTAEPQ